MGTIYTFSTIILLASCTTTSPKENDIGQYEEQLRNELGQWKTFDMTLSKINAPQQRDLLLLTLAVEKPKYGPELCQRVAHPPLGVPSLSMQKQRKR